MGVVVGRPWLTSEMRWLRENYAKLGPTRCAECLNRTVAAVSTFATVKMGLKYEAKRPGEVRSKPPRASRVVVSRDPTPEEIERMKAELRAQSGRL